MNKDFMSRVISAKHLAIIADLAIVLAVIVFVLS